MLLVHLLVKDAMFQHSVIKAKHFNYVQQQTNKHSTWSLLKWTEYWAGIYFTNRSLIWTKIYISTWKIKTNTCSCMWCKKISKILLYLAWSKYNVSTSHQVVTFPKNIKIVEKIRKPKISLFFIKIQMFENKFPEKQTIYVPTP